MTREEFCKQMRNIKKTWDALDDVSMYLSDNILDNLSWACDVAIGLLKIIVDDKEELIEWFVYETNFGEGDTAIEIIGGMETNINSFERLYDTIVFINEHGDEIEKS